MLQPPPEGNPLGPHPTLLPFDENFESIFLDFFSLQYGQSVSSAFAPMD
jgi:hypothetical protein